MGVSTRLTAPVCNTNCYCSLMKTRQLNTIDTWTYLTEKVFLGMAIKKGKQSLTMACDGVFTQTPTNPVETGLHQHLYTHLQINRANNKGRYHTPLF